MNESALLIGQRLGPYEILSALGAGGMGEVYKARDTRLDRTVAVKVLPAELAADADRRARFEREARAVAALSHPHICVVHDVGRHENTDYLVMEYLEGETLAERVARSRRSSLPLSARAQADRPLPINDVLRYAIEIADALDKAHRAGIVHRDLKPANVMLTKSGVKLLDFGLAKLKGAAVPISMTAIERATTTGGPKTATGTILGTVHYMAPEQVEGREADARSDIWALGVVIYEMATGTRPFEGDSGASIIGSILKDIPPPVSARQPLSPASLDHVVARCLEKDPDERWQTVADVKRELIWIAQGTAAAASANVSRPPSKPQRLSVGRLLPWALVLVLAAIVGVSQLGARKAVPALSPVIKLDLNMPPGVEVATTNTPNIALSPDGSRIAFTGTVGGLRRIYVRPFGESEATMLRGTDTANVCFMSPDGATLGFVTADRILKKVSIADGLVTTIATEVDYSAGGGVWGPDDRIVFVRSGEIWDVPSAGGPPRQLTRLDHTKGEMLHSWPTIVGAGKAILFTTVTTGTRTGMRIDALMRDTGERRTIVEAGSVPMYASSGHLIFFRDNALIAAPFDLDTLTVTGSPTSILENFALDQLGSPMVAISNSGSLAYTPGIATRRLVWVSRSGVEQPINDTPRPYQNPRLAPDGHRIVVEIAGGDLWLQDTARATFTRLTTGQTIGNTFAVWTPNSQRIVFRTVTGLWMMDVNGGQPQSIPGTSVTDIPTSISPDGQTLAYIRQTSESAADIYTMSLSGDPKPQAMVRTSGYDGGAQFSPDGHWLAYVSNESGQSEVYVRPYPGPDRKLPVSTQGGTHPKWNRNGKELFYRSGNKMMVVDVPTHGTDMTMSEPRILFDQRYAYGSAQTVANFDVSADGQRFVMVKDDSASGRLNIVLNWFEELKARVPLR
jgi:eukaryotic-like serine/threonine-protein kinase